MIARFNNNGEMQGSPVRVNPQAGVATAWRGDQPSVALLKMAPSTSCGPRALKQETNTEQTFTLSVSNDRGQTFSSEVKINDDKVPGRSRNALACRRKRWANLRQPGSTSETSQAPKPSTKADGHHMESNRDSFISYSTDGGRTFSANRKVASEACPCCKTALAVSDDGTLYAGWRQVLPGSFRHIAVIRSKDGGATFSTPKIVSDDRWVSSRLSCLWSISFRRACGTLQVLWYAAGEG